jgi:hypothetical protein
MRSARRSIFRYEAIRRYAQGRGKAVLPRFVRPLTFVWLWVLLGLLLVAAGYLASSARERLVGGEASRVRGYFEP